MGFNSKTELINMVPTYNIHKTVWLLCIQITYLALFITFPGNIQIKRENKHNHIS